MEEWTSLGTALYALYVVLTTVLFIAGAWVGLWYGIVGRVKTLRYIFMGEEEAPKKGRKASRRRDD